MPEKEDLLYTYTLNTVEVNPREKRVTASEFPYPQSCKLYRRTHQIVYDLPSVNR